MSFLPGFDERWRDAPDFLDGIDREVWNERRLDRLKRYYPEDAIVRTPEGLLHGGSAVLADAQALLARFPDLTMPVEETLWGQAGYKSFLGARRLKLIGPQVAARVMLHCWCRGDEVADVWRITDRLALCGVTGQDVEETARAGIHAEGGPERCARPLTTETDVPPKLDTRGNENTWSDTLADALKRIMQGDASVIEKAWDRAAEVTYPGGIPDTGHVAATRFWTGLRASFPSALFTILQCLGMEDAPESPRASVLWTLSGGHDGHGMFGAPSGAQVHVMGMTQAEFGPQGLRREWTLIDPLAIWRQILLSTGAV